MTLTAKNLWRSSQDYIFITFGTLLYAFGYAAFVLPQHVVIGGVTGLGSIVFFLTGNPFFLGLTPYAINIILLIFAWRTVGKDFVYHTIYGATTITLFITLAPFILPHTITPEGGYNLLPLVEGEPFMNVIIGALLGGLGLGLVFVHNGSTGGTDIVAAMVSRRSNVSVGRVLMYVDFCIISSSFLIFHQINSVIYGIIFLLGVSYMCDVVINSNRQAVQFTIFSPRWEKIATAINTYAHRGVTVVDAMGWYSKTETKMLIVMARKIESVTIYRIIKSIDPDAFVTQGNVRGVYGNGFDHVKIKDDNKLIQELEADGLTADK